MTFIYFILPSFDIILFVDRLDSSPARVYVFGLNKSTERELLESTDNAELVRCSLQSTLAKSPSRKMMARFLSYDDPKVSHV